MTTSDNMLVEAIRQAIDRLPIDESYAGLPPCTQDAEVALQAICIYSDLTVEVIEMIRRGEAIVIAEQDWQTANRTMSVNFYIDKLNTLIERREG